MPSKRSELGSHEAVVTGVLNSPDILRLRAVRSVFPANIPVHWKPMRQGSGYSFTMCPLYTEYVKRCSKESSDSTNPDSLIRVDVRGVIDDVRPKKTGPKGPRKPLQLLDANMVNIMNELQAPCSGDSVSLDGIPPLCWTASAILRTEMLCRQCALTFEAPIVLSQIRRHRRAQVHIFVL